VLGLVPARALVSEAVGTALVTAVSHRVRALVRAATLLVAADLAEAPLVLPAIVEAPVWAVADSVAAADVQAEAVAAVEAVGGNGLSRKKMKPIPIRRGNLPTMTGPRSNRQNKGSVTIDLQVYRKGTKSR
jgi:hypothetical protein